MTREERAREVLAEYLDLADDTLIDAVAAMLAFADAEAAAMRERAALACEDRAKAFLSPEYATGQPFSSLSERFACAKCAEAVRALPATGEVGRG